MAAEKLVSPVMVNPASPVASPSMTERRGIQLRIHVIPPEGAPYEEEGETTHHNRFYDDNTGDNNTWSPPSSRLSSCSDGSSGSSSCNSQKHLLCLPSNSELSPSYYSSSKGTYYYQPNRRDSSGSYSSGGGSSGDGSSGPNAMSLSPSSQSISSYLSVGTNTLDGSLSPYCLSPTISRPPSTIGWRNRANTTVNHHSIPRGSKENDSLITDVESGNESGRGPNVDAAAQFRTGRSWTFSSGNRRKQQRVFAEEQSQLNLDHHDSGSNWTPPPIRSTSPHPLGYYSDSAPPIVRATSPSPVRSGSRSPLLQYKMVLPDTDDPAAASMSSALVSHRSSISGAIGGGGRRFSVSVHHPHSFMPLVQQMHHSHLLSQHHQQPSSYSLFPPIMSASQRRRGSAAAYSIVPSCTVWDAPPGNTASNLTRLRRLGHSCPQLNSMVSSSTGGSGSCSSAQGHYWSGGGPVVKLRRDIAIQRRHSNRMSRRSFNANSSPLSSGAGSTPPPAYHSGRSPLRNASPNLNTETSPGGRPAGVRHGYSNQPPPAAAPHRRNSLRVQCQDARRWSVTSLPSSGYGTPGSSAVSSQYSSQERLLAAMEEQRYQYDSNDSNPSSAYYPGDSGRYEHPAQMRLRSRSLSSIAWLNLSSSRLECSQKPGEESVEVALRNNVYKERFPKAKRQMEEKLEAFLAENSLISTAESTADASSSSSCQFTAAPIARSESNVTTKNSGSGSGYSLTVPGNASPRRTSLTPPVVATDAESLKLLSDGSARFIHHQIMESAMDCLQRSKNDSLSSAYFCEFAQNLEELLEEAKEKAVQEAVEQLSRLVKHLLLIVSRSARLLECLEFDPEEFYRVLHEAEGHAKEAQRHGIGVDVPQYIIRQLGLSRGAPEDVHGCLTQSTDSGNVVDTPTRGVSTSGHSAVVPPSVLSPSAIVAHRRPPPKEADFDIIKLVSNGAYGAVFLVRHKETRRRFALKKLSKSNLMLRNQIDQVYAERDILTFTDNPFVVSFYGSFETKRHLCMVMEYVEGGDCATLLKTIGVMPVEMAQLYIAEAILAIEYLHSYGIVHRDLKPDNLLITAFGHIKLTDFGLSKIGLMNRTNLMYEGYFDALMSETTQFQDRQICGTPEYIAPEVILRQGYGKPVDWWALGVILYEFLVGTVPFFGDTPEQLFSHVINDEIEWPEEPYAPPEDAQDLVTSLLQQNPLQRLGTVSGAVELKEHRFFASLDWNSLLRQKAEFIPQLEGEEDTSYFDTRADRYNHDLDSGDEEQKPANPDVATTSTNWPLTKGSPFASFSSSSPRYSLLAEETNQRHDTSSVGSLERSESSNISADTNDSSGGGVIEGSMERSVPILHRRGTDVPAAEPKIVRPSPKLSQSDHEVMASQSTNPPTFRPRNASPMPKKENISAAATAAVEKAHMLQPKHHLAPEEDVEVKWRRKSDVGPSTQKQESSLNREISIELYPTNTVVGSKVKERSLVKPIVPGRPEPAPRSTVSKATSGPTSSKLVPSPRYAQALHHYPSVPPPGWTKPLGFARKQTSDDLLSIPADTGSMGASASTATTISPTCSSAASSRDPSPTRITRRRSSTHAAVVPPKEIAPIMNKLKPPVVIKRGIKGFGFTIRAIRVYLGDTDYYTIQHLVVAVESGSPAFDAGLRPNDLLTHINGESVKNLTHTDVIQRLMTGGDTITLRVSPLESTTIRQGGPVRKSAGKLAKRKPGGKHKFQKRSSDKNEKRRSSLLRRLSGKRGSFEAGGASGPVDCNIHQPDTSATPTSLTDLAAIQRSISNSDGTLLNPSLVKLTGERVSSGGQHGPRRVSGGGRGSNSSRSNGSTSSVDTSSANDDCVNQTRTNAGQTSRPYTFFGLRNKVAQTLCPRRQISETTQQLSPLARTDAATAGAGEGSKGSATSSTGEGSKDSAISSMIGGSKESTASSAGETHGTRWTPSSKAPSLAPVVQKEPSLVPSLAPVVKTKNSDGSLFSTGSELSSTSIRNPESTHDLKSTSTKSKYSSFGK